MTAQPDIAAEGPAARQNAAIVVRFFAEVLATGAAGRALGFLADDFVDHDPAADAPSGSAGVTEKLAALWRAFPDGRFTLVAAGDRVVARSILTGTQSGRFGPRPATGAPVSVSFSDWYRLCDGLIAEHWHNFDEAGLMRQLGIMSG